MRYSRSTKNSKKGETKMLNKLASQMTPQTVKAIKIGAIAVAALAGAVVTGVVLYKMGLIGNGLEVVEDVVETAAQAA